MDAAHETAGEGPALPGFRFVQRWGGRTWLGRTDDGAAVVGERVTVPPQGEGTDRRSIRQAAAAVLATRHPALVPVRRIVGQGRNLWLLSDADDGVSLHRLLDRAKPSLAEAASLAALALEAVAALHEAGHTHGGLDSRSVRIGPAGEVRLAGWAPNSVFPAGVDRDLRRADLRAAAGIVGEIAGAAGRPARPLTEQEDKLLARLSAAADPRKLTRRDPRKAAHGLDLVVGGPDRQRAARHGLVTLVRAVTAADAPDPAGETTTDAPAEAGPAAAAAGAGRAPLQRSLPPPHRRPPIWPRIWKGAAIGAVVALLFGTEIRFFGDRVQHNVHVLLSGDTKPAAAGPRRPDPLPVLAPGSAGPVTHLELRPLDGCRPGGDCNAVVQVTVAPQGRPLDVAWGLEVIDRCGAGRESRPGGVMSIPPGRDRAVQTLVIALPLSRSLAVIPVTSAPVRVAGTAMQVSPDNGPC